MERTIEYAIQFFLSMFQLYCIYRYMTIFFENKYINKKWMLLMYACRAVLSIVFIHKPLPPLLSLAVWIISTYLIALSYYGTFFKRIVIVFIIYMSVFIAESVVALAIGIGETNPLGETMEISFMYNMVIQFIFWSFTLVMKKLKNIRSEMPVPKLFIAVILTVPISSICLEIMIFNQPSIDRDLAGMSIIITIIANFVLFYLFDSLSALFQERAQSLVISREKDYYHEQLTMLHNKNEELRQFRHDVKNRLAAMQQMLKQHNYEQVMQYTDKIAERLNDTAQYSNCGNIAIDSILNYKLSKAKAMGIDVKARVVIPADIPVDEDDIVVILGNILDNAIDANERVSEGKYIRVDFDMDRGNAFIRVKNRYDSVVNCVNGKFLTRKEESQLHGIGLKSVDAVVQKYNGLVDIEYDETEFVVNILMYL